MYQNSEYFGVKLHMLIAVILNCMIVSFAPHSFCILPNDYIWVLISLLSSFATFNYLSNTKQVQIFNFEQIFIRKGGHVNSSFNDLKQYNPIKYYIKILDFFKQKYPGTLYQFKRIKRQDIELEKPGICI